MQKSILAASIAAALSLTQTAAFAEAETLFVTATRSAHNTIKTPSHVSTISQQQIADSGVQNVTELLRSHGGIQISDTFGDGNLTIISMRGMGETGVSNVLVIVDGRKLNNPDISSPDLNSVSLNNIDRIEIIQGSAGTIYGDQAVAGVINIITKIPSKRTAHVEVAAGSYDKESYEFAYSDAFDNGLSFRVSADDMKSDGYRDDNDKERTQYFGRVDYSHDNGNVFIEYQDVENNYLSRGALSNAQVDADRKQAGGFISVNSSTAAKRLGLEHDLSANWKFLTELSNRDFDNNSPSQSISFGTSLTTTQRNVTSFTPRVVGNIPMNNNADALVTIGVDIEDEEYFISNTSVGGIYGDSDFTNDQERQIYSGYLHATIPLNEKTELTVGTRYSEINAEFTGSANNSFGSSSLDSNFDDDVVVHEIGLSFQAAENIRTYIRRDENFRFAKTNELADIFNGLTSLKTQEGVSYEAGIDWKEGIYTVSASLFQLDIENEIGAITDVNSTYNVNFDDTRRRGINVNATAALTDRIQLSSQYSYVNAEFTKGAFDNNDIPFVANHQLSVTGTFTPRDNLKLFTEVLYTGSKYSIGDFDNTAGKRGGYTLLNAAASYVINNFTVMARINNLTNKKYSENTLDSFDYATPYPYTPALAFSPSPERNFTVSISYDLN